MENRYDRTISERRFCHCATEEGTIFIKPINTTFHTCEAVMVVWVLHPTSLKQGHGRYLDGTLGLLLFESGTVCSMVVVFLFRVQTNQDMESDSTSSSPNP